MKNATHNNLASQFRWRVASGNGQPKRHSRFQPNPFGEDRSCDTCGFRGHCEVAQDAGGLVLACTYWKRKKATATSKIVEWWKKNASGYAVKQLPESEVRGIAREYYEDGLSINDLCAKYHHGIGCLLRNCAKYGIELKRGITWAEAKERWGL